MHDLHIDRVEAFAIGPPTQRLSWALGMDGQYMTFLLLRISTRGGLQGLAAACCYSEGGWDLSVLETLRPMIPLLLGQDAARRESIWNQMLSKTLPRAPQAQSMIDVALWDIAGKQAGMPLYRLLGGYRERILSYASTPLLESPAAYVEETLKLRAEGFKAIKFHCWCEPRRDIELIEAVRARVESADLALMLDVEQRYDYAAALEVGRVLGQAGYRWFEAPLDDFDLPGYRDLSRTLDVPVIAAGNSIVDHRLIAFCLQQGIWRSVRVDAMSCGGITPALKILSTAESFGATVELQCWGYTLHQAANLHLMLARPNVTYFEQPTRPEIFEFGSSAGIRTNAAGTVGVPDRPCLGFDIDFKSIEPAVLARFEVRGR